MKKKNVIIIIVVLLIIILSGVIYFLARDKYSGTYEIKVELVDDKSPDRVLVVLRNGKETKEYKYIKYVDGVILCEQKNSTVNMFEIEDELIIVLPNDSEVKAKVLNNK